METMKTFRVVDAVVVAADVGVDGAVVVARKHGLPVKSEYCCSKATSENCRNKV